MSGVAGDEDRPLLEPCGPVRARVPALDVLELHFQTGISQRIADQLHAARVARVLPQIRGELAPVVHRLVDDEEARVPGLGEPEEPLQPGAEHVDHAQVAVAHERSDVRSEVDRDAVGEGSVPAQRDTEAIPDRATTSVGRDQVPGPHGPHRATSTVLDDRCDSVPLGLERDQLGVVLQPRTELLGLCAKDRLEPDLGDEDACRRAEGLDAVVDVAEVVLELPPAERLDRDDGAVLLELPRGGVDDRLLQPGAAVELDRPLVEQRGARVNRRARVALDDE